MLKNRYKNPRCAIPATGKMVVDFFEKEHPFTIDLLYILADVLDKKVTKKDFINLGYGNNFTKGEK
jgi:hypothetical protein